MDPHPPHLEAARFRSADLPARERVAAWREFFAPRIFGAEIEPLANRPFEVDVSIRQMPLVTTMTAFSSLARVARSPHLLADGRDCLGLIVSSTPSLAHGAATDMMLQPGDGLIASATRPLTTLTELPARYLGIFVAPGALAASVDPSAVRRVPAQSVPLRYLTRYLEFAGSLVSDDPTVGRAIETHVLDLLSLVMGARADDAALASARGLRAARLQAIKADIAQHRSHAMPTIEHLATRHGVTPRHIQRLFEAEGTTFSNHVRQCRLLEAHRMLRDPRCAQWKISTIAYEAGFAELSYFNRSFRRQFGLTPGDVRRLGEVSEP